MPHVSLEEHYRRNITFPEPYLRMVGLEAALTAVEEQLDHLQGQRAVRLYARLKREAHAMASEDIECEIAGLKDTVEELFPKVFRGGFVISLWSVFRGLYQGHRRVRAPRKNLPFGLQDLRAGDFLEQTEKFFSRVLSVSAFPDKAVRKKLEEIKGMRNALAHHDGNTLELPKSLQSKTRAEYLKKGLIVCRDLHHEYAVPTAEHAEHSLKQCKIILNSSPNGSTLRFIRYRSKTMLKCYLNGAICNGCREEAESSCRWVRGEHETDRETSNLDSNRHSLDAVLAIRHYTLEPVSEMGALHCCRNRPCRTYPSRHLDSTRFGAR